MAQQFGQFTASELYCPKCKSSQPVRERLLLVLPTGELHEFLCSALRHFPGQAHGNRPGGRTRTENGPFETGAAT